MIYLRLCLEFFKTGLFAVGGGLATLPFLSRMSEAHGWFSQEDLGNMLAVSESTPGPIGVNMATYVGNIVGHNNAGIIAGIICGLVTTFSLILPSYLIVLLIQKIMTRFRENRYVIGAMKTLRPASVGMVAAAVIGVLETVLFRFDLIKIGQLNNVVILPNLLLFVVLFVFYQLFNKLHPIVLLAIGAAVGIIFGL